MVVFASESASPRIPRRAVFVQVFEDIEMAGFGSSAHVKSHVDISVPCNTSQCEDDHFELLS